MARSIWKGPFVDGYLLQKAEKSRSSGRNEIIKTWSRRSTIMIKATFQALRHSVSPRMVAQRRGKKVSEVLGRGTAAAEAVE